MPAAPAADRAPPPEAVVLVGTDSLGDGLLTLALARNLRDVGRPAVLYSTPLVPLAAWFPGLDVRVRPAGPALDALVRRAAYVGHPELLPEDERRGPPRPGRLVYSKAGFGRRRHYVDGLAAWFESTVGAPWRGNGNGLVAPPGLVAHAHPRRVAIHPTSRSEKKNWPAEKFVALARRLASDGFEPVLVVAPAEAEAWRERAGEVPLAVFPSLHDVAAFLHESGAAIATDSGIGHLASNVGLPTLSLFRKSSASRFWRPVWGTTRVVRAPFRWPGRGGHRRWGAFLTVGRVRRAFRRLLSDAAASPPPTGAR